MTAHSGVVIDVESIIVEKPQKSFYSDVVMGDRASFNQLYVRSVDMVLLNELILNRLIEKGVLSSDEARLMIRSASSGKRPIATFLTEEGKRLGKKVGQK